MTIRVVQGLELLNIDREIHESIYALAYQSAHELILHVSTSILLIDFLGNPLQDLCLWTRLELSYYHYH